MNLISLNPEIIGRVLYAKNCICDKLYLSTLNNSLSIIRSYRFSVYNELSGKLRKPICRLQWIITTQSHFLHFNMRKKMFALSFEFVVAAE